jgi:FixJ family two-component response regulator
MRARDWMLPVIAITGKADARLVANLKNAGACAVFEKPVDEAVLLQAIESASAH